MAKSSSVSDNIDITQYVDELTAYIEKTKDGTLSVDKKVAKVYGRDVYNAAMTSLENTNSMISTGYLTVNDKNEINITSKYIEEVSENCPDGYVLEANNNEISVSEEGIESNSATLAVSGGVSKIVWTWYGFELYLSDSLCDDVVGGMSIVAGLGLFIPDPLIAKLVAAALLINSGLIAINNNGNGVKIKFLVSYNPLIITPFWFSP